jgi:hypothetical protein
MFECTSMLGFRRLYQETARVHEAEGRMSFLSYVYDIHESHDHLPLLALGVWTLSVSMLSTRAEFSEVQIRQSRSLRNMTCRRGCLISSGIILRSIVIHAVAESLFRCQADSWAGFSVPCIEKDLYPTYHFSMVHEADL